MSPCEGSDPPSRARLVEGRLRRGSVVVADNARSFSYAMRDYLDHVRGLGLYESQFVRGGWDGMEVSVRL